MTDSQLPFITVCMPVRNEECFLRNTLLELVQQKYPHDRFEIIVADGDSEDKTREIVSDFGQKNPQVILMRNPARLPSSGRNVGIKHGRGDIFLVVDGHCRIDNDRLFMEILTCFEKSGVEVLCRPQPLDPPDISDFQKAVAFARASKIGHGTDSLIYSNYEGYVSPISHGAVYKKEIFDTVGLLDETFDACEDVEFNYRVQKAGFRGYMSPTLAIKYYPRENLKSLFKQMVRYGSGRFQFLRKHPEAFSFKMVIPFLFTLGLFLAPPLFLLKPSLFFLFAPLCLIYLSILLINTLSISIKHGFKYFPQLSPIYFLIHFGLGFGILKGLTDNFCSSCFYKSKLKRA